MVQIFECGGDRCPGGGVHDWGGPEKVWTNPCASCNGTGKVDDLADPIGGVIECDCERCKGTGDGGGGSSATCSKCGLDAMSHTLMNIVEPEWPPTRFERIDDFVAVHLLQGDGTSWCSMSSRSGPVSTWPVTDRASTQPDEATCKACLGRYHRAKG